MDRDRERERERERERDVGNMHGLPISILVPQKQLVFLGAATLSDP